MSPVRHGVAVKRIYVRCMVNVEDTIRGRMAYERSLKDTFVVRKRCTGTLKKRTLKFRK